MLKANSVDDKAHSALIAVLGETAKRPSLKPAHRPQPADLPPLGGLFAMLEELPDDQPTDFEEISPEI